MIGICLIVEIHWLYLCLLYLFVVCTAIQLFFYLFYFTRLFLEKIDLKNNMELPISILIAVKNEVNNIDNIKKLLNQDYDNYEVVIVNNHSVDKTLEELYKIQSEQLKVYDYFEKVGKKAAIEYGITKSSNEHLLFIDADCKVISKNWVKTMASHFNNDKQIVIGFSGFLAGKGLLNAIIRFENLLNSMQILSFAIAGEPYSAIGRNMGYTKTIYKKSNVFKLKSQILSGDDDLIVNEMANRDNVAVNLNRLGHTYSVSSNSWLEYYNQRRRQLIAGNSYKIKDKIKLAIFGLSNLLFYFSFIILIIRAEFLILVFGIFVVKLFLEYFIFNKNVLKLNEKQNLIWLPLLEPTYMLLISLIGISTWIWKVKKWK